MAIKGIEKEARNKYYLASKITSLGALQTECRFVESSSTFRLKNLVKCRLTDQNNALATQATYEDAAPNPPRGKVILVEYKDNKDYIQNLSDHVGDDHISDGDAFIQEAVVKIMIFRQRS